MAIFSHLTQAKDYVSDMCSDLCESIQSGGFSLVQDVRIWYETSSSPVKAAYQDTDGADLPDYRYRRRDVDFVLIRNQKYKGKLCLNISGSIQSTECHRTNVHRFPGYWLIA